MSPHTPINELINAIHRLDRERCKAELLGFQRPKLDFTEEHLNQMSTEWLRHVLLAAYLQARKGHRA